MKAIFFFFILIASTASAELKTRPCAPIYGGVSFIFNSGVSPAQLAEKFVNIPWAREIYRSESDWRVYRNASFYARLKTAPNRLDPVGASGVDVPVGSEEFLADQLQMTNLVHDIALPWGDCGGAEIAYFSLGGLKDQSSLKIPTNFQSLLRKVSAEYVNSRVIAGLAVSGVIEVKQFTVHPIEPNLPVGRIRFRVASEISRDRASNHTWDQFDAVFSLWKLKDTESLVTVSIEGLMTAPRAGRDNPPSEDHFRPLDGEQVWYEEATISSSIAAYFAAHLSGKCVVDGAGFSDSTADRFGCDAVWN